MDKKRIAKRITAGYKAEITYEGITYHGVVENLSETGASITLVIQEKERDFIPGKALKLKFEIQPGETLDLNCTIKWSTKLPPHGLINGIGVVIIDPPWKESSNFL
ncbi:PilZ domain protein [bacterium BMS3Abin09]|nr:PilZ domain protein [bacterium BMS3Abin09]GBE41386.1 PilZ domain protein [bacterium BMS3Bbin09]HDH34182.1 PilZ domain-containing protein [Nitrospirota bacterium]HDO66744.1 PilZ domain-containing protein [Nitrospirota bacterium]HEW80918.1 PilZ domain-containing protein [Nitrospirota bacterium]